MCKSLNGNCDAPVSSRDLKLVERPLAPVLVALKEKGFCFHDPEHGYGRHLMNTHLHTAPCIKATPGLDNFINRQQRAEPI